MNDLREALSDTFVLIKPRFHEVFDYCLVSLRHTQTTTEQFRSTVSSTEHLKGLMNERYDISNFSTKYNRCAQELRTQYIHRIYRRFPRMPLKNTETKTG